MSAGLRFWGCRNLVLRRAWNHLPVERGPALCAHHQYKLTSSPRVYTARCTDTSTSIPFRVLIDVAGLVTRTDVRLEALVLELLKEPLAYVHTIPR